MSRGLGQDNRVFSMAATPRGVRQVSQSPRGSAQFLTSYWGKYSLPSLPQGFVRLRGSRKLKVSCQCRCSSHAQGTWALMLPLVPGMARVAQAGVLRGVQAQAQGDAVACPRRARYVEASSRYCLLYIIYLVLIYNCMIVTGS